MRPPPCVHLFRASGTRDRFGDLLETAIVPAVHPLRKHERQHEPRRDVRDDERHFQGRDLPGPRPSHGFQLHRPGPVGLLRRAALPPRHCGVHESVWVPELQRRKVEAIRPGRPSRRDLQELEDWRRGEAEQRRQHQRRKHRPDVEQGRHALDGQHRVAKLRRLAVLPQRRAQRQPRLVLRRVFKAPGLWRDCGQAILSHCGGHFEGQDARSRRQSRGADQDEEGDHRIPRRRARRHRRGVQGGQDGAGGWEEPYRHVQHDQGLVRLRDLPRQDAYYRFKLHRPGQERLLQRPSLPPRDSGFHEPIWLPTFKGPKIEAIRDGRPRRRHLVCQLEDGGAGKAVQRRQHQGRAHRQDFKHPWHALYGQYGPEELWRLAVLPQRRRQRQLGLVLARRVQAPRLRQVCRQGFSCRRRPDQQGAHQRRRRAFGAGEDDERRYHHASRQEARKRRRRRGPGQEEPKMSAAARRRTPLGSRY